MKFYLVIILSLACLVGYCNSSKIDSLVSELNKKTADTSRISIFNQLANEYRSDGNYDSTIIMANQALALSIKLLNEKGKATAYGILGAAYYHKALYPQALHNNFLSLKIKQNLNDKKGVAALYNNIGNVYREIENYKDAIDYFNKSIEIKRELKDEKGIAASYINIGNVYAKQSKHDEALNFYQKSLIIKKKLNDLKGVSILYNNLGIINNEQGLHERKNKHFAKADSFFNAATLKYQNAIDIKEKLKDKTGLANAYCNMGNSYCNLNNTKSAEKCLNKSLELSSEVSNLEDLKNVYHAFSVLDSMNANYKSAYINYKKYTIYRDSINNEENTKKSVQEKIQYEFDLKEKETKLIQEKKDVINLKEKQKQFMFLIFTSVGLLVVAVFAFIMFNRFKLTKKQNSIIKTQKLLVEEKHKEITDSINYAERIQRSLLASKKMLDENLKDYFILFKPKDIVSGDFYWATSIGSVIDKKFVLVTADSTGHGVPGAIMSIVNIASLKEAIVQGIQSPDLILNETRRLVIENLKNDGSAEGGKDGMDASLICVDFKNYKMTCACANNPIWIVRQGELIEIKPDRMPIGKHDKDFTPFNLHSFDLQKEDVIYTLTDGYPDQFGGNNGKKFKTKQLQEILVSISSEPMETQKRKLEKRFDQWRGNLEQVDDVCVIGIRI